MLTIFTVPKPFVGHIKIIQKNAIQSWLKLSINCEIILFGDEIGVAQIAKEFNIRHISKISLNKFGTPLINEVFLKAQKVAQYQRLVYINADIILMSDFIQAVQYIKSPLFIMAGRRWDIEVKKEINFNEIDWENKLRSHIINRGKLHGFSGIDYFVFPRRLLINMPPFAVGRPGWDNCLIYHMHSINVPIIDASEVATVIHQNHKSIYHSKREEVQKNLELTGGFSNMCTLRDADWILTYGGLKRPSFLRRFLVKLSFFYLGRLIISLKRKLQRYIVG